MPITTPSKSSNGFKSSASKPIDDIIKEDLGVDVTPRLKQLQVEEPPKWEKGIMVKDVAELVQKLKNEAKVI